MGYKLFYRVVFSLFLSLNVLVYLAKTGNSPIQYLGLSLVTFGLAYLFAMLVFRKIGWKKEEID